MSDAELRELERVWRASRAWPEWVRWARRAARDGFPAPLELARALPRIAVLGVRIEALERDMLDGRPGLGGRRSDVAAQLHHHARRQKRRAGRALAGCRERRVEPFWPVRSSAAWERGQVDLEGSPLFAALMEAGQHWLWHREFLAEERRKRDPVVARDPAGSVEWCRSPGCRHLRHAHRAGSGECLVGLGPDRVCPCGHFNPGGTQPDPDDRDGCRCGHARRIHRAGRTVCLDHGCRCARFELCLHELDRQVPGTLGQTTFECPTCGRVQASP